MQFSSQKRPYGLAAHVGRELPPPACADGVHQQQPSAVLGVVAGIQPHVPARRAYPPGLICQAVVILPCIEVSAADGTGLRAGCWAAVVSAKVRVRVISARVI